MLNTENIHTGCDTLHLYLHLLLLLRIFFLKKII